MKRLETILEEADSLTENNITGKITLYEAACALDPVNTRVLNNLGYYYWKDWKEAKKSRTERTPSLTKAKTVLTKSLQIKPFSFHAYYFLGLVSEAEGDEEKALAMYEEARNITMQQGGVYSQPSKRYAELQLKRNAPRKALNEYRLLRFYLDPPPEKDEETGEIKFQPRYLKEGIIIEKEIIDTLDGKIDELKKRKSAARKHVETKTADNYRKAIALWADSAALHFEFAEILGNRNLEEAIEHAEIALGLDPLDSHAHVVYGRLLEKKAEKLRKNDPQQWFMVQKAIQAYKTAVELSLTDNYYTGSDGDFGQKQKRHGAHERLVVLYEAIGLSGEAQKHRELIALLNCVNKTKPATQSYTVFGDKPVLISVIHASESYALHTAYTLGQEGYPANLYFSLRENCGNNTPYEHALIDEMLKKHKRIGIISLHVHQSSDPPLVIPLNIIPRVYPYDLEIGTHAAGERSTRIKHGPSADNALLVQIMESLDKHHVTHCENLSRYGGGNIGTLKMKYGLPSKKKRADIIQLEFDPRSLLNPTFMLSTVRAVAETMQRYVEAKHE